MGNNYIMFKVKDKPSHPIVKALRQIHPNWYDEGILFYCHSLASIAGDLSIRNLEIKHSGWTWNGYFIACNTKDAVERIKAGNGAYFRLPKSITEHERGF